MRETSDVFDLSKSIGYNPNWTDEQVRTADKVIRMHDELVTMLGKCRDKLGCDCCHPCCDKCNLDGEISTLLERCK